MSITEQLKAPFDPKVIHWRIGATNKNKVARETGNNNVKPTSGIALAYLDSRDVMKRFDDVCGDLWQVRYPFDGCCEIGVKIGDDWIWRSNGAGETAVEGEKGKYSDAFKRAAVLWGVGRYLYYLKNSWVTLENGTKFTPPTLPPWALPKPENK